MIQSMTGFGRSSVGKGVEKISVSIKCVNGKVLDLKIKGLDIEYSIEKEIRDLLSKKIIRGTVYINFEPDSNKIKPDYIFNENRLKQLIRTASTIEKNYNYKININEIITANDLLVPNDTNEVNPNLIFRAVKDATAKLIKMRKIEGAALKSDLLNRVSVLKKLLFLIEKQLPNEYKNRIKKIKKRITDLLKDYNIDDLRMNQEIAHIADKSDVTEEIVRLKSHFSQFENILNKNKPAGRGLNFLLQEIIREINTLGSKSFSEKIVKNIIKMKEESEKIREQVQNIL
tara:strand:+ start:7513 stop:8373 length:861 start_codon:yes stop_codon:yes gene_type:complete